VAVGDSGAVMGHGREQLGDSEGLLAGVSFNFCLKSVIDSLLLRTLGVMPGVGTSVPDEGIGARSILVLSRLIYA